jgi:hypothetical protein
MILGATATVGAFVACSSSSNNNGNSSGGVSAGNPCTTTITCAKSDLNIVFSPMYSAYITDDNGTHTFKVPAIVDGISDPSNPTAVTWGVSDPSAVSCATDPTTGGVMITVQKAEDVTVVAQVGGASGVCGSAKLGVTSAHDSDWQAGNARYNNNVPFYPGCVGLGRMVPEAGCPDAGPACTSCHGPTANATVGFSDISHTPEQTGGFSDDDLTNIIVNGTVPDGGYFDDSIVPYRLWQRFHTWTDVQPVSKGMIVYLRSLEPEAQMGMANFGGRGGRDGGRPEGGYPRGDGGGSSSGSSSGSTSSSSGSSSGSTSSSSGSSSGSTSSGSSSGSEPVDATVE